MSTGSSKILLTISGHRRSGRRAGLQRWREVLLIFKRTTGICPKAKSIKERAAEAGCRPGRFWRRPLLRRTEGRVPGRDFTTPTGTTRTGTFSKYTYWHRMKAEKGSSHRWRRHRTRRMGNPKKNLPGCQPCGLWEYSGLVGRGFVVCKGGKV